MARPAARADPPRDPSYFELTSDLAVSLILVLPLLAVYQMGLLLTRFRIVNGVDFLTRFVYVHWGTKGVVLANLTVIAIFLAAIIRLEKQRRFRGDLFAPLVLESALYASVLGSVILFVLRSPSYVLAGPAFGAADAAIPPAVVRLVLSIGAGVNEEIVFRLGLIGLFRYIAGDFFGAREGVAFAVAAAASALLFSGAHYVGRYGDPFTAESFAFRAVAGLIFAGIYRWRSFAVAVYTHAIYDIFVFFR